MKSALTTHGLLQMTHAFPCAYLFKVIGRADHAFVARVVSAVREELLFTADPPYRVREAVGGRHLSVTLEPVVQSAEQVVAVYRRLGGIAGVVMLL